MNIVSLRDGALRSKQSPTGRGDCFAIARNDNVKVNALREPHKGVILQSATGEELDALPSSPSAASGIPSVLEKAFKGEL
jgi:hypothetical protein